MLQQLFAIFPGIGTLFIQEPVIAFSRVALIALGFLLSYLGFKRTLEPLIMVPMGLGMMAVNAGVMFLEAGKIGTLIIAPMVSEPNALLEIMQIDFLQPVYNFTFTNSLVACLLFMGIGTMADISFILARPWASVTVAICAELGTFVTLIIGYYFGLTPAQAAAAGSIGGADGPMVLFASLVMAKELFVPISIIAYLYLSLTYAGYPYLVRWLISKKHRGLEVEFDFPEVSQKAKFVFTVAGRRPALPAASGRRAADPVVLPGRRDQGSRDRALPTVARKDDHLRLDPVPGLGARRAVRGLNPARPARRHPAGPRITALAISALGGIGGGWLVWWISKGNYNR